MAEKEPIDFDFLFRLRELINSARSFDDVLSTSTDETLEFSGADSLLLYLCVKSPELIPEHVGLRAQNINNAEAILEVARESAANKDGPIDLLMSKISTADIPYIFETTPNTAIEHWSGVVDEVKNVLVVPIYGEDRILGVVELVNVLASGATSNTNGTVFFSTQLVGRALGSKIRNNMLRLIQQSSLLSTEVIKRKCTAEAYISSVGEMIVNDDLTQYGLCIVRICNDHGRVELESRNSAGSVDWSSYVQPMNLDEAGLFGRAYRDRLPVEIASIDKSTLAEFGNAAWVEENGIRAYYCMPILHEDLAIGTISLFLNYPYKHSKNDQRFLELLAHSLGKTIVLESAMNAERASSAETQGDFVREISRLQSVKEFAHIYKNDARLVIHTLESVIPSLTKGRTRELHQLIQHLENRKEVLQDYIETSRGAGGQKKSFSLNDLVREIIDHNKPDAELSSVSVNFNGQSDMPFVYMNRGRLMEAVSNIYDNAIKACKLSKGNAKREVEVSTYIDNQFNDYCIQITDNGVGIDSELKEAIFDEGVSMFDGTGQGLYFSKRILDELVGEIHVVSTVGRGSTFTIRFPLDIHTDI